MDTIIVCRSNARGQIPMIIRVNECADRTGIPKIVRYRPTYIRASGFPLNFVQFNIQFLFRKLQMPLRQRVKLYVTGRAYTL